MRFGKYESSDRYNNLGTAVTFLLIGLGAGALARLCSLRRAANCCAKI